MIFILSLKTIRFIHIKHVSKYTTYPLVAKNTIDTVNILNLHVS